MPTVHSPDVDESSVTASGTEALVVALARLKGESVLAGLGTAGDLVLVACDSLLDLAGEALGKPADAAEAALRWRAMRGRTGTLITGHHVVVVRDGQVQRATKAVSTTVRFAQATDAEIAAYIGTGEPLAVAGAFTIDGFGAPWVAGVEGDPLNVVGISVSALRDMLAGLGVFWPDLWGEPAG